MAVASGPLVSQESLDLIVRYEVGSQTQYERLYTRPICPLCATTASGVTIGIGYDIGHASEAQLREDWYLHPQLENLVPAVGLRKDQAIKMAWDLRHVYTSYGLASHVFNDTTVLKYYRVAHRAFGQPFLEAPGHVRGALVSLVYNRGGAMGPNTPFLLDVPVLKRDSRWEMRVIRDVCLPQQDYACVAKHIRHMKRLWPIQGMRGLHLRRDAEAALVEKSIGY